jgi:hypothetical protein
MALRVRADLLVVIGAFFCQSCLLVRLFETRSAEKQAKQEEKPVVSKTGVFLKRKKWLGTWSERLFILTGSELSYAYPKPPSVQQVAMGMISSGNQT